MSEDKRTEGFRVPPDLVSTPCLVYMARITELRDFISFFFGIVKSQDAFIKHMKPDSAAAFKGEAGKYLLSGIYNYSSHRQFINEVMLSRAVETFELYVLLQLRAIFTARPEILKSEGTVDVSAVIELKNFDDIVEHIAEKKLHELSYKPLSELRKYIESRTGIDIFPTDEAYNTVLLASEVRNLIAHNDCRVNEIFERRVPAALRKDMEVSEFGKIIITDKWVADASYMMDGLVFDFDTATVQKFAIHATPPKLSFLFG